MAAYSARVPSRTLIRARTPAIPPGSARGARGENPSASLVWNGGSQWPTAAPFATPSTVAGLPAAARALNMIAGIVCQLPLLDREADGSFYNQRHRLEDP